MSKIEAKGGRFCMGVWTKRSGRGKMVGGGVISFFQDCRTWRNFERGGEYARQLADTATGAGQLVDIGAGNPVN
jgi:hypothetical protein